MVDETVSGAKKPNRQSRSCRVCRLRKVKCDRVKPCHACCAHGHPSKCVYEIIPVDDVRPISQAEEIRNLRAEIKELRHKIDKQGNRARGLRRLAQLEGLFESIRSAPLDVVDEIVGQIRSSRSAWRRPVLTYGPWEGHEAYEDALRRSSSAVVRRRGRRDGSRNGSPDENGDVDEVIDGNGRDYYFGSPDGSDDDSSSCTSIRPMSSRPMLDVFVERFVDAFSPEVDFKSGQAGAIRAAAEIRMFSPLIQDAFEAVSIAFFGRSIRDKRIETAGFQKYPRVLRGLQDALQDPERSKAESTLVTVTLLIAFESVERTTHSSVAAHVMGAVRLIEHRGPENHMYGVEHLLFTELRPYWVGGALVVRSPSFLARDEWKTIPWSAGTTVKDILHHLLDLAVEIPALLGQFDELQDAQQTMVLGARELTVKQTALWNGVADLTARYLQWKIDWVDHYQDGPPRAVESQGDDTFPVFRCRDLRTGATVVPTTFVYPNLRLAQTMCLYYTTRLILSTVDTRPVDRVTPMDQYGLACDICRSLEWYIRQAPGNMINRLAFPVRVAWEAFPETGPERRFITEVLQLVEKRHALGLWGGGMEELSPRAGSPPR